MIGAACFYPDAPDLGTFWENILARRQAFRPIPRSRLDLSQYGSDDPLDRDRTYAKKAALISGFAFDWRREFVPKATFDVTDTTHWLALDCARRALEDSGIDLAEADRTRIGVVVGNSLTGELSRANSLRLRWPFVEEVLLRCGRGTGMADEDLAPFLASAERMFKDRFPAPNEDWLAGVLSNVVAGRICNRLDLNGGGFTVDGACASSLLAVKSGCEMLVAGDLDIVLAGGVDISLDPLELVGFARIGALTRDAMRVYDKRASGFIPGEGCGFVVLTREAEAARMGARSWAAIDGWGVSSDGSGGVTAPKPETQALAIARCYDKAEHDAADLDFIEGHGTGTPLGDRVELTSILTATAREGDAAPLRTIGVTSVKTLIGHTKAAAGIAGFLKSMLAVNQRVLPPLAGLDVPNDLFGEAGARIYPIRRARTLSRDTIVRAGVSSAGFGGINCHIGLSSVAGAPRALGSVPAQVLAVTRHTHELVVASGDDAPGLADRLQELAARAEGMAECELADFAARAAREDQGRAHRAGIVVGSGLTCAKDIRSAASAIAAGTAPLPPGVFVGQGREVPRVGFMFPGQGAHFAEMGTALRARHAWAAARTRRWDAKFAYLHEDGLTGLIDWPQERCFDEAERARRENALRDTRVAQPAIVMTALQWLDFLRRAGVEPTGVIGHSLGEVPAMIAADLLEEREAMDLLRVRAEGAAGPAGAVPGAMASLAVDVATAKRLIGQVDGYLVVANENAPRQTVVAGTPEAIRRIVEIAVAEGLNAAPLNVSNAFHSRYMDKARDDLAALAATRGAEMRTGYVPFFSGVTGGEAEETFDPYAYLTNQIVQPVRFVDAARALIARTDVLIELGPGSILTGLVQRIDEKVNAHALEPARQEQGHGLSMAFGALYAAGQKIDWNVFYGNRLIRPFVPAAEQLFLRNPAGFDDGEAGLDVSLARPERTEPVSAREAVVEAIPADGSVVGVLRQLIADETGYSAEMIAEGARLVSDLNLDSIKVGEVIAGLRRRGIRFADEGIVSSGTIAEIAAAADVTEAVEKAPGRAEPSQVGASSAEAESVKVQDVPVMVLEVTWKPAGAMPDALPGGTPVAVLSGVEDAARAEKMVAALSAIGLAATMADAPVAGSRCVLVLPGQGGIAALADLVARAAPFVIAAESLCIVGPEDGTLVTAALGQSLSLERARMPVLAVTVAEGAWDQLAAWVAADLPAGAHPLRLSASGAWRLGLRPPTEEGSVADQVALSRGDVVVASGGAKGITLECCLALGQETGARFALLGRSPSEDDPEIAQSMKRFRAAGIEAVYVSADVGDSEAVKAAVAEARAAFDGAPVAGLVHGAGINLPALIADLDAGALSREMTIKAGGFGHLLDALRIDDLKLCIGFGSVIGVTGMYGNAGYGLANALLAGRIAALRTDAPHVRCACLAYGVWAEVGMGAKLGVVERLERQGIHPLKVVDGVAWFLRAARGPDLPVPLVVSGPMAGAATWRAARRSVPAPAGAFLGNMLIDEPGAAVLARYALNTKTAPWLDDHNFNGTLLMPMVFAIAAMSEAAAALTGGARVGRVADFDISAAISVGAEATIEIDIDARPQAEEVAARVGMAGAPAQSANFRARLTMDDAGPAGVFPVVNGPEMPAEVSSALYDWLLFQGPLFQKIARIERIDVSHPVHRKALLDIWRQGSEGPMPDPYFIDAMLQAMQILVPRDVCLPARVASLCFFDGAYGAGRAVVCSEIMERTEKGYVGRITARDGETGGIVAVIDGLVLIRVSEGAGRPDLPELLDPLSWDQAQLVRFADTLPKAVTLDLSALRTAERAERREAARTRIALHRKALARGLYWTEEGAPVFRGVKGAVSISHDGGRLLVALGDRVRGCDLQAQGRRGASWREILPERSRALWNTLSSRISNPEGAAAIVWAAEECLTKAGCGGAELSLEDVTGTRVRLAGASLTIHADILELSLAGPAAIAVALERAEAAVPVRPSGEADVVTHFHALHRMSFKEALPPARSAPAPVVFSWIGWLREAAMEDINPALLDAFQMRSKGILTNMTEVGILRPPVFGRDIECWVWFDRVLDSAPSTFELSFDFAQRDGGGRLLRCAQGKQRLTWVHLEADGTPRIEPFPDFFAGFIDRRNPAVTGMAFRPLSEAGDIRWEPGPEEGNATVTRRYDLDESHSNFVGNIYFGHLATLADRTARGMFARSVGRGLFCRRMRLDHSGEAMPGDTIEIAARQAGAGARCVLRNVTRGAAQIGLAVTEYAAMTVPGPVAADVEVGNV